MRYWSILFALTLIVGTAVFVYAPFQEDWWLPNYLSTNKGAYEDLQAAAAEVRALSKAQSGIAAEAQRLAKASPSEADKLGELAKRAADLQTRLDRVRPRLDAISNQNFLPGPTRTAAQLSGEASEALAKLREASTPENLSATLPALDAAKEAMARATTSLDQALANIHTPTSTIGRDVDHLFVIILAITGIVFIATEAALCYVMWKYQAEPGRKSWYMHGSQRLEIIWTIIPSAILVFIALYQMGTWAEIKFPSQFPKVQPLAEVSARQFQWIIRYPGEDGILGSRDDLFLVNDLHFVKDKPAVIHLKSQDVLHSFFLPQMRVKQDAVPGLTIPVWFDADKAGQYELVCAELCGWGHYKMRANVTVHETQREFDEWMRNALREQNSDQAPQQVASAAEVSGR